MFVVGFITFICSKRLGKMGKVTQVQTKCDNYKIVMK